MKKTNLSKIVLATSLAALLTACGGSGGSSDTTVSGGGSQDGSVTEGLSSTDTENTNSESSLDSNNSDLATSEDKNSEDSLQDNQDSTDAVDTSKPLDNTSPSITLNGDEIITIAKGSTYIDQGAKAIDDVDGNLNVTISDDIDTDNIGTYTITYKAIDNAGNESVATRTVHVTPPNDSNSPTIFLKGDNPMVIAQGSTFDEPGATATDPQEGDLSDNIRTKSDINPQNVGAYSVDYTLIDGAGNKTTVRRIVEVKDQTSPVITINGDKLVTKNMEPNGDRVYLDAGATATDNVDDTVEVKTDSGDLNLSKPGTYTITYSAVDKAGNKAEAKRTLQVIDNGKPIISLKGDNPMTVAHKGKYDEKGATAKDEVDGENLKVSISGVVDTNKVGAYNITYSATDSAGNKQTIKRVVKVTDQTAPTITLNGKPIVTVTEGNPYDDLGAKATDLVDGTVTVDTNVEVDTSKVGTYTLKYIAKDSAGNKATAERKVYVVLPPDIEKPQITILGENPMRVSQGSTFSDPYVKVTDNRDISIPVVDEPHVDTSKVGTYKVTYKAQDRAGNIASATREVKVVDDGKPTITLNGQSKIDINEGTTFTDPGAIARDNVDQNVNIVVTGTVDSSKPGTYTLTYSAKDGAGNEARAVTRTIIVHDITKPLISLNGESTLVIKKGGEYKELRAEVEDNVDKDLQPTIKGTVDTDKLGTYTITYNVSDKAGNMADQVVRTVYVVDNEAPEITLTGENPMSIAVGSTFNDPGATAEDKRDGEVEVVPTGDVDTSKVGVYTITYKAVDSAGNVVTEERKVYVINAEGQ